MSFQFVAVEAEGVGTGARARHTFEIRASFDPAEQRRQLEELVMYVFPGAHSPCFEGEAVTFIARNQTVKAWVIEPAVAPAAAQDQLFAT